MKINFKKATFLLASCLTLSSLPLLASPQATKITTDQAPSGAAYSQGVRAGDFVYIAGQIGMSAKGVLVGTTIEEQTTQALKNLAVILAAEGLTFDDVIKTQVFLKDAKDFTTVNTLYTQEFKGDVKPVRTTVITNLPKDALIEIDCVAYAPQQ